MQGGPELGSEEGPGREHCGVRGGGGEERSSHVETLSESQVLRLLTAWSREQEVCPELHLTLSCSVRSGPSIHSQTLRPAAGPAVEGWAGHSNPDAVRGIRGPTF